MNKTKPILLYVFLTMVLGCSDDQMTMDETSKDIMTFKIVFDGAIPIDHKIEMTLIESTNAQQIIHEGSIERRGGSSISFAKHSFEIDLKKDVPLLDLPSDDDWILNANYIDKTFLRHVICYELFSALDENNLSPATEYVELELNHEYNGLYVLMEKLDKSSLEINDSKASAFIFKEPHIFRETYDGLVPQAVDNFHQQTFPKIEKQNKREAIKAIRNFILDTDDAEFENSFSTYFDLNNIMDWQLLLLITNNSDGILKNFYLYKQDDETPIRIAPWDYDHSFGRDGDNELNMDTNPLTIERSILFKRLLQFDWYKSALKERWTFLNNENFMNVAGLKQRVQAKSALIKTAANRNFERWPLDGERYYDYNDFDEEINVILDFIDLRHARLTEYFDTL